MRIVKACLLVIILFSAVVSANSEKEQYPLFGNALFTRSYGLSVLDGGQITNLSWVRLANLNIEQASDLLSYDIRFFAPDLVTNGQEVKISMLGSGERRIKTVWRGRPLRDPITGNSDLNRLSALWITGLRSVHIGALGGITSANGMVDAVPVDAVKSEPLTLLHHRDGYYGFQPVEFVHTRRLSPNINFISGGYFPSSKGRFNNAEHNGSNLFAEVKKYFTNDRVVSIGHQTRNEKVGIAFTENSRSVKDNDFDISFENILTNGIPLKLFGYHLERAEREGKFRAHSRDLGVGIRYEFKSVGYYGRIGCLNIDMPSTEKIRLLEVESSFSAKRKIRGLEFWGLFGVNGWLPDRTGLNLVFSMDKKISELANLRFLISRNSDPLTAEILFADYAESRPSKLLNTVWQARPDLPVKGKILPKSTIDNIELSWNGSWHDYIADITLFQKSVSNPVIWKIEDNTITPSTISDQRTRGWLCNLGWKLDPYRANLSMISLFRNEDLDGGVPVVMPEPGYRLTLETGWHRIFMNGRFEADISLSGNYLDRYFVSVAEGWDEMGGAYPLDFRMSGRIRTFTLYYGVHNWNSYQYYTVPGYRMMHKEEYWGIHWQIMN